jgi:hypothetical protein
LTHYQTIGVAGYQKVIVVVALVAEVVVGIMMVAIAGYQKVIVVVALVAEVVVGIMMVAIAGYQKVIVVVALVVEMVVVPAAGYQIVIEDFVGFQKIE